MGVFYLFLLALAAGCLSTLFWIPEDDMGRGYFQMNALVVLCLLALAASVFLLPSFQPYGPSGRLGQVALGLALLGAFGYYTAIWRQSWRPARWMAALSLAGTSGAMLLAGPSLQAAVPLLPWSNLLFSASLMASGLILGWSLITMLLGHWYLVAPKLTFRHLVVFCRVLVAVVVLRIVVTAAVLGLAAMTEPADGPNPMALLASFDGQGMFFWFRVLWGLVIPLGLGLMSLHCAVRRSNQSATGILYVLVVGSFIGEITAVYIALTTGIPI